MSNQKYNERRKYNMKKKALNRGMSLVIAMALFTATGSMAGTTAKMAKKANLPSKSMVLQEGQKKSIVIKNKRKGAKYTFTSSAKKIAKVNAKGLVTAVKKGTAKITVKESYKASGKKKTRKLGVVKVKVTVKNLNPDNTPTIQPSTQEPVPSLNPVQSPAVQTPVPDVPSPEPVPSATPDIYTKELFSVNINTSGKRLETVEGSTYRVDMQYFDGDASGEYFNGSVYKESSNVTKTYKDGRITNCARYILEGNDDEGNTCKIFIQDEGVTNDGVTVTKPRILTNSPSLSWMEKADIQGRVETDDYGDTVVTYVWNESNEKENFPEPPKRPDMSRNYTEEIFTFYIDIGGSDSVTGSLGSATMIHFTGRGECDNFNGKVVADSVDTRLKFNGMVESLSARYILDGTDAGGNPYRIYVENNGIDDNGMVTEPVIITDSPDYAWVESAPLHGTVSWEKGLTIHMWTVPEVLPVAPAAS